MKLSSAEVELTFTQFEAQVIPDDHPLVPKLNELFGDHTFFLNGDGLNVVELHESTSRRRADGDGGKPCQLGRHAFDQSVAPRT
jgi:hypothetical protein